MEEPKASPEAQIPPSVSYRQLAAMLPHAPTDPQPQEASSASAAAERQAFEGLLAAWRHSSHQLLAALGHGGDVVTEGRSARQVMALGALQAHIALALQAHAAATGTQAD